jgi:tetratricopeptide (TPR) repeat protein
MRLLYRAHIVAEAVRCADFSPARCAFSCFAAATVRMAWLNKGSTPDNVAQARNLFDRALSADPDNVEALIGSARADVAEGAMSFATDPMAAFAAAEAKLTKLLSLVPDHARGHMSLGAVEIWTKRAAEGIAECEHALGLDRNLAHAHATIGLGKIFIGRPEESEAHIAEALRVSPRDSLAYVWMTNAGFAKTLLRLTTKRSRSIDGRSRQIEIIRFHISRWPPPSRGLIDWSRRVPPTGPPDVRRLPRPRRLDRFERRPDLSGSD